MQADSFFRYRKIGRCPSPPTWGCYELAASSRSSSPSGSDRSSDSSEDEDDDVSIISEDEVQRISTAEDDHVLDKGVETPEDHEMRDVEADAHVAADALEAEHVQVQNLVNVVHDESEATEGIAPQQPLLPSPTLLPAAELTQDPLEFDPLPYAAQPPSPKASPSRLPAAVSSPPTSTPAPQQPEDEDAENQRLKRQDKGKGREIIPESIAVPIPSSSTTSDDQSTCSPESTKKRGKKRAKDKRERTSSTYRPILTIRASHGWIWNQDLFVPNYLKDRYLATTTQPSTSTYSTRISVAQSGFNGMDFEVECVEIRVTDKDLMEIIPP